MAEPGSRPGAPVTMIGQVLDGRYRIVGELGRGGIGIVYRAQQMHVHDRDVAVKILNGIASMRASTAHRFETEARIIADLRHPNTIKLIDTGRTKDGRLYIVTEYLHGVPLSQRLAMGPLGAAETVRLLQQIAEALIEAHEKGVVHRDLKPANVFLEEVGSQQIVKVLDFGIAKLVDAASLTAPMQIFGTPGFMAPEQCLGETVGPRADLYAVGVLGYLCLTGQLPVDGHSVEAALAATIDRDPVPLREHLPEVDPELEGLIMQLLAKAPSDRLPDARAVRDACAQITRALARTDAVPLPGQSQAHLQRSSRSAASWPADMLTPPTPDPDNETEINARIAPDDTDPPPDPTQILLMHPKVRTPSPDADAAPTLTPAQMVELRHALEAAQDGDEDPPPRNWTRSVLLAALSAAIVAGLAAAAVMWWAR